MAFGTDPEVLTMASSRFTFSTGTERQVFDGSLFESTDTEHAWLARAYFERDADRRFNAFRKVTPASNDGAGGRSFPAFDRCYSDSLSYLPVSCKFETEAGRTPRGCTLTTGGDNHRRGIESALSAGLPYPVVYGHRDPAGKYSKRISRDPMWRVFVFDLATLWTGAFEPARNRDGSENKDAGALCWTWAPRPSGDGVMVHPPHHPNVGEATETATIFYKALRVYTTRTDLEWSEFPATGDTVPEAMREHILDRLSEFTLIDR